MNFIDPPTLGRSLWSRLTERSPTRPTTSPTRLGANRTGPPQHAAPRRGSGAGLAAAGEHSEHEYSEQRR